MTHQPIRSLKENGLKYGGLLMMYLTLIAGSIKLTIMNRPLYVWILERLNIPEAVNMSRDTVLKNYDQMMNYLNHRSVEEFVLPDFSVSKSGAFHFWEVRNLFTLNNYILLLGGLLTLIFFYYIYQSHLQYWLAQKAKQLLWVPPVVILLLALFFDQIFVWFHELAFDNDAWIFNPVTDPVINILPPEYFMACFISVFLLIECGTALIYWGAKTSAKLQD